MARADRRQQAREARRVQRRPSAAGSGGVQQYEDTLFFSRLRAHAKWVFVLLAIVFAGGFVFLGVGSGSSGLGDLLQGNWGDLFGSGSGSSAQVKADRDKVKKNPKDWAAYRDLASALAADGKLDEAITTLEGVRVRQPKKSADYGDTLTQLAGLYLRKASDARDRAGQIQVSAPTTAATGTFGPDPSSKLGQALQSDPITQAVQTDVNGKLSDVYDDMTSAFTSAVSVYKAVAEVTPNDPGVQFALAQTAEQAADTKTALAAYQRFLELAPDDPTAPAIKQRIKQLKQQSKTPAA
jgi:tetratricopeptide (TPR) repeat protein